MKFTLSFEVGFDETSEASAYQDQVVLIFVCYHLFSIVGILMSHLLDDNPDIVVKRVKIRTAWSLVDGCMIMKILSQPVLGHMGHAGKSRIMPELVQ